VTKGAVVAGLAHERTKVTGWIQANKNTEGSPSVFLLAAQGIDLSQASLGQVKAAAVIQGSLISLLGKRLIWSFL